MPKDSGNFFFFVNYIQKAQPKQVVLLIYLAYLSFGAPMSVLQLILILGSNLYLILAFRKVYGISSWFKAIVKSLFINVIYMLICILLFLVIFVVSCMMVADNI